MHDRKRVNSMTRLLNKIERRLGTQPLNLPSYLSKDSWATVIAEDSLHTFSLFFPHIIRYEVDTTRDKIDEMTNSFYIDQDLVGEELDVLGMRDISMDELARINNTNQYGGGSHYGGRTYGFQDIASMQMRADLSSFSNTGIFVDFKHPNKLTVEGVNNSDVLRRIPSFGVDLFIVHPSNLATISPTMMIEFERLAILDIKIFLYQGLKHFDNIETVYANVELLIDDWSSAESDREQLISEFKDAYVSAANTNQPMIWTI